MVKKIIILVVLLVLAMMFWNMFSGIPVQNVLPEVSEYYAKNEPAEVGAANLVTAVVVTYRGLDTLGEVSILFLSAAIVGLLLGFQSKTEKRKLRKTSELLLTAAKILTPVIVMLGVYVFINGHLTPGGGFQGGAIIAAALVLALMADPLRKISHGFISFVESTSGFIFVFIGILGIFLAGGFLDNSILPLGEFGAILSAGAIPIIYSFIGLKVGAELSSIVSNMQEAQNITEYE